MPLSEMARDYSNCPLKKRPVFYLPVTDEPENLSTKPEDLNRTARFQSYSPASLAPSSPRSVETASPQTSPERSSPSPISFYHEQKQEQYPTSMSPDDSPQNWHKSVSPVYHPFQFVPYSYHQDYFQHYGGHPSPIRQVTPPIQPVPIRATPYQYEQHIASPSATKVEETNKNTQCIRHECPNCGKSYSTFSGLTKHKQFHCAAGDGPKKSFSCKYCNKMYTSLGALKMHIRTHTLPCKCTICGKAFSRPWLLQGHIRTHTGEKPFSCTFCNRAFADRSNLRAHLQTHTDVKKYSCTKCSKTFSRASLLTKHTESGCSGSHVMLTN